MTALNECRSPQWNVTYGGRALCLDSSVPGRLGSRSISETILPVCVLTSTPVSVVSKKRSTRRTPEFAPV